MLSLSKHLQRWSVGEVEHVRGLVSPSPLPRERARVRVGLPPQFEVREPGYAGPIRPGVVRASSHTP